MARFQYRISGNFEWLSNSGNAVIAITNPNGSGKKLVLKRLEITPNTYLTAFQNNGYGNSTPPKLQVVRGTPSVGKHVYPTALDTDKEAFPDSIQILTLNNFTATSVIRQLTVPKLSTNTGPPDLAKQKNTGMFGGIFRRTARDAAMEGIKIRNGEAVGVICASSGYSMPYRVSVRLSVLNTSTAVRSVYMTTFFSCLREVSSCVLSVQNNSAGNLIVEIDDISVEETGQLVTPYFQLAHVAGVVDQGNTGKVQAYPLDTDYPDGSSFMTISTDAAVLPIGINEDSVADSAPITILKGLNYLKTKDFTGPILRSFFPEAVLFDPTMAAKPDNFLTSAQQWNDILIKRSDIVIREGETIALVSAAETATGATSVPVSGYHDIDFGFVVDVEPSITPELTLTGLKPGTEIRIFEAGTGTEVAGQESVISGSFTWVFDPSEISAVDISILSLNYQNTRITDIPLTSSNLIIPVQQQLDRQYANP